MKFKLLLDPKDHANFECNMKLKVITIRRPYGDDECWIEVENGIETYHPAETFERYESEFLKRKN